MPKEINDIDFAKRVKHLVDAAGGQGPLARLAGISQQNVGRYLSGSEPRRKHLVALAKAGNCSISWLATGQDEGASKLVATIEPGQPEKKAMLREAGKRIIDTDPSLRMVVEWMDEYFQGDPDQIPGFVWTMAKDWPSFAEFLEKKGFGRGRQDRPLEKKSVNNG